MNEVAARAWAHRAAVERASTVQFERLVALLHALDAPLVLINLAGTAADDERRHEALCTTLARSGGVEPRFPTEVPELAPSGFDDFERCAWLAVAHCCIAETESVATLSTLVPRPDAGREAVVQQALVEIARDEVKHAQLGWAVVNWLAAKRSLSFLAPGLPAMLEPGARPLYGQAAEGPAEAGLFREGVLPVATARALFEETLFGVVLPGLARVGVDGASAREWVARASQPPLPLGRGSG